MNCDDNFTRAATVCSRMEEEAWDAVSVAAVFHVPNHYREHYAYCVHYQQVV
jgi:hypothetical protein